MAKHYILIDYENVKVVDVRPITDKSYHLMVFVGASQSKISTDFAMQVQNLKAAEYVRISGNGHNALDFHIAYMIGRLAEREPEASFHIVSKDRGFDPLITYLTANSIKASRVGDLFEIRALRLPKAVSDAGIVDDVGEEPRRPGFLETPQATDARQHDRIPVQRRLERRRGSIGDRPASGQGPHRRQPGKGRIQPAQTTLGRLASTRARLVGTRAVQERFAAPCMRLGLNVQTGARQER